MADMKNALAAIEELIASKLEEVLKLKVAANTMATAIGEQPPYDDAEADMGGGGRLRLRSDQFVNEKAPASAARAYMALRGSGRGATTLDDIHDALSRGGYDFGDMKEAEAKAGLRIALAKDAKVHKLANGSFGLREWYKLVDEPEKAESDETTKRGSKDEKATKGKAETAGNGAKIDQVQ
jgi:hypothetical protein